MSFSLTSIFPDKENVVVLLSLLLTEYISHFLKSYSIVEFEQVNVRFCLYTRKYGSDKKKGRFGVIIVNFENIPHLLYC